MRTTNEFCTKTTINCYCVCERKKKSFDVNVKLLCIVKALLVFAVLCNIIFGIDCAYFYGCALSCYFEVSFESLSNIIPSVIEFELFNQ